MSAHGIHNKEACDELITGNKYFDWIVTTAFYSSIHFVDSKLFPCKYHGKFYRSVNEASRSIKQSRHYTRELLVIQEMPQIQSEFKFLLSTCSTARYNNYKISPDKAKLAREYLDAVINECSKR